MRDLQADAAKARTRGDNEVYAGRESSADTHYSRVFQLETQSARLQRSADTLRAAECQIQDAEAANSSSRAFSRAALALESANSRMPAEHMQRDVMRMQMAKEQMSTKMEMIDDAMNYDDDQEETAAVQDEKNRIAALKQAALLKRMPGVSSTSAMPPRTHSAAAAAAPQMASSSYSASPSSLSSTSVTADDLGLPSVRPLPKRA